MNATKNLKIALVCAGLLSLPLAHAATMSRADYSAAKTRISDTYKADKSACGSMKGNAKDVCVEEAKAKEKVARAELEYEYTGKASDRNDIQVVKAKTAYSVAKERCDDQSGNAKDVCVQEAKAARDKALADAKMGKEIGEAKHDAAVDKSDADYKVAVEKCDAMTGDAKTNCLAAARTKYGK